MGTEWLILYDFNASKQSTTFWTNLKCLGKLGDTGLIQYSVLHTDSRRVAVAAKRLAEYYGATTIIFKGNRNEP